MGKFLDKTGLQTFLNKLKTIFVNKSGINTVEDDFSLELNNLSDTHTIIDKNGISQTNNIDNYYMSMSCGELWFRPADDNGNHSCRLDSDGLMINVDYGLYSDGMLLCDRICNSSASGDMFINFNTSDGFYSNISFNNSYATGSIEFHKQFNETKGINFLCDSTGVSFGGNIDNIVPYTHMDYKSVVAGLEDNYSSISDKGVGSCANVVAKNIIVAPKIAIGRVNSINDASYTITGSKDYALMADGSTAYVATRSTQNGQVSLNQLESFISQDEFIGWNSSFILLHYPMDVGETTIVHLTILKCNQAEVTRIIEIDTINKNSTIKLVIDSNDTSINFTPVNNREFSGRFRIYCYLATNDITISEL